MKTISCPKLFTRALIVPFTLLLLLLAGCLEKRLVWSPDGSKAAVISDEGLYISDPDGKLSTMLPNVYLAAWLSDSRQLVIARKESVAKWNLIARAAGTERAEALIAEAEAIWQKLQTGGQWGLLTLNVGLSVDNDSREKLRQVYLRERYGEALRSKISADEWNEVASTEIEIHELLMAKLDGDRIVTGTQLYEGLGEIGEIKLAPADRAVAFLMASTPDKVGLRLMLARVNGSGATSVADHVSAFPDWTPDGRSIVYVQATGTGPSGVMELGTLVRHEVLNAEFRIAVSDKKEELAGLAITELNRVRCLRDGRIIFNAAEIQLPVVNDDFSNEHEQLFAIDPARQPTLVRLIPRKRMEDLPQLLGFFEVSPDEKQILFGGIDSSVSLLTIATGEVAKIQSGDKDTNLRCAPTWRSDGEFFYAKRFSGKDGKKPARPVEAVLRNGDNEKVLSTTWSDEMMHRLFGQKSFP